MHLGKYPSRGILGLSDGHRRMGTYFCSPQFP